MKTPAQAEFEYFHGLHKAAWPDAGDVFRAGWDAAMLEVNGYTGFERGRYCAHHGELQPCSRHRWVTEPES